MGQYNRLGFRPESNHFKAAVYIHGANHGQFNRDWGNSDSGPGLGAAFWNTEAILPAEEQETATKVFISAFLEGAFGTDPTYLNIFQDWRLGAEWLPDTIYLTQYDDAGFTPVADFEEDLNTSTVTLETGKIFTVNLRHWKESTLTGKWNQDLSTSAVTIAWDNRPERSFPAVYGIQFEPNSVSVHSEDYLVFSMGDTGDDPNAQNAELFPDVNQERGINFSIELSSANHKAVIRMDEVMLLQPQIKVELAKAGFLDKGEQGETVLQRFYIPIRFSNPKIHYLIRLDWIKSLFGLIQHRLVGWYWMRLDSGVKEQMNNKKSVYWLGGAPCAGKSTIAEKLAEKHNLTYYRVDDHFERHMNQTNPVNHPACETFKQLGPEEIWMASVSLQLTREWEIYQELFDFILADLMEISKPVIVEGAGCLPELVNPFLAFNQSAAWMVPTDEFHDTFYEKRDWAPQIVKDCSNPAQAYLNWMKRDHAFGERICQQTKKLNLSCLVVDGSQSIRENIEWVEKEFELE